jgi:hypothetical protein
LSAYDKSDFFFFLIDFEISFAKILLVFLRFSSNFLPDRLNSVRLVAIFNYEWKIKNGTDQITNQDSLVLPPLRLTATNSKIKTAPPTIQTQGALQKEPPPSLLILISTSADFSWARQSTVINVAITHK